MIYLLEDASKIIVAAIVIGTNERVGNGVVGHIIRKFWISDKITTSHLVWTSY